MINVIFELKSKRLPVNCRTDSERKDCRYVERKDSHRLLHSSPLDRLFFQADFLYSAFEILLYFDQSSAFRIDEIWYFDLGGPDMEAS